MPIDQSDLTRFRDTEFGRSLPANSARRLLDAGTEHNWGKGHTLFQQGEDAESAYVLLQGRVSLTAMRTDGEEAVLEVLSAGDVFPIGPVLLRQALSIGAQAITNIRVLQIPAATFLSLMASDSEIAQAAQQQLSRDWQQMVEQNKALKLQNTNQRLARFLLQHTDIDDGAVEVRLLDERRLLARRLGMTPESLSRAIAQLTSCGVEFSQQRVLIRDVDRLRQFCGLEVVS